MRATVIMAFCAALLGCPPSPQRPPDPNPTDPDAGPMDADEDAASPCSAACRAIRAQGCPEGFGSPEAGVSCYRVCLAAGDHFDARCAARAKTRDELAACRVRCVR